MYIFHYNNKVVLQKTRKTENHKEKNSWYSENYYYHVGTLCVLFFYTHKHWF